MEVVQTIDKLREALLELQRTHPNHPRQLVPTMGALHEGHRELLRHAVEQGPTVATLFVNPLQFGPNEDFDRYPRDLSHDQEVCQQEGISVLFAPFPQEMALDQQQFVIQPKGLIQHMCGPHRPGHFEGVCHVVMRLFSLTQPDEAWFGQKDFQQYRVLEAMVDELALPIRMHCVETVREADGLALSSRNRYLSPQERGSAVAMFKALEQLKQAIEAKEASALLQKKRNELHEQLSAAGFRLEYVDVYDVSTLTPVLEPHPGQPLVVAAAGWLGQTRLIDNLLTDTESI
ncbi:MAG: pantoate--beta-alanine ligase [Bacteroidetes bacterium]|nr:pantoate--beta-alanine ligase [Bacteroidota bacterium]